MKNNLLLLFLVIKSSVFSQQADIVLLNGKIITLKEKGNRAEAVALKADKIVAVTTNNSIKKGAYTTHEENKKGKIIPGQLADIIVLDKDPTAIDPLEISSMLVTMTMVGGQIAFQKD